MDSVIHMNSLGAAFLEDESRDKARIMFRACLGVMSFLSTTTATDSSTSQHDILRNMLGNNDFQKAIQIMNEQEIPGNKAEIVEKHTIRDAPYYIHLRALNIQHIIPSIDDSDHDMKEIVSACILFNMAILDHHEAYSSHPGGFVDQALLKRTFDLYVIAFDLLADPFMAYTLRVAITNNIAVVLYEMGKYTDAIHCRDCLSRLLDEGDFESIAALLDERTVYGFCTTANLLQEPTTAGAA